MGEGTYSKVKHCTWTKPGETPPEKKARAIKQLILETIKKKLVLIAARKLQ